MKPTKWHNTFSPLEEAALNLYVILRNHDESNKIEEAMEHLEKEVLAVDPGLEYSWTQDDTYYK